MHVRGLGAVTLFLIVGARAEQTEMTEPVQPDLFMKNEAGMGESTHLSGTSNQNNGENDGKTKEPMPFG